MKTIYNIILMCVLLLFPISSYAASTSQHITVYQPGDYYYNSGTCNGVPPEIRKNCVCYARWLTNGKLPTGLTYWDNREGKGKGKYAAIKTHKAKAGYVAMMNIYKEYGHAGYVYSADTSGKKMEIVLLEANYQSGKITRREIKGSNMQDIEKAAGIVGYWKP